MSVVSVRKNKNSWYKVRNRKTQNANERNKMKFLFRTSFTFDTVTRMFEYKYAETMQMCVYLYTYIYTFSYIQYICKAQAERKLWQQQANTSSFQLPLLLLLRWHLISFAATTMMTMRQQCTSLKAHKKKLQLTRDKRQLVHALLGKLLLHRS